MQATMSTTELLTPRQVSDRLHLAVGTLANWRAAGTGPRFLRLGSAVRYRESDLETWANGGVR